jgi:peroxiredoxin (alkyl hydroperoxide reductase subunit C)
VNAAGLKTVLYYCQNISFILDKEELDMSEVCCGLRVGEKVPDFELEMFDPVKCDFGKISLKKLKAAKKWTVLFYYPADFTFV